MTGARTALQQWISRPPPLFCDNRYTMAIRQKGAARRFKVLLEWDTDDEVWVTYVPTLGSLSTYGNTRDEALEQTREAILGYLEAAAKEGIPIPSAEAETEIVELEVTEP